MNFIIILENVVVSVVLETAHVALSGLLDAEDLDHVGSVVHVAHVDKLGVGNEDLSGDPGMLDSSGMMGTKDMMDSLGTMDSLGKKDSLETTVELVVGTMVEYSMHSRE